MSFTLRVGPKRANDTSENTIGVGSAKALCGRVFVLSVFLGSDIPWLLDEIQALNASILEAERWLTQQAARYGKNVEFYNYYHGADGRLTFPNIPVDNNSPQASTYWHGVLTRIGWRDGQAVVDFARQKAGCDQSLVLVFGNVRGRSYACQASSPERRKENVLPALEACCLLRPTENSLVTPSIIAHEMLHLFGAWDLYKYYLDVDNNHDDSNRAMRAQQMFPNSIMLTGHHSIDQLVIDEVNAWLVGLKEEGKDWYRWFEPMKDDYGIT